MTLQVETLMAVTLMMAVFSAIAAVGTSIVLGAGFERLRSGFEVIRKQTGFFSDAIHKLEQKVEVVDEQTANFSSSIEQLEQKVGNVGEQANAFADTFDKSMKSIEKKVDVVDKQTGFFSETLHKLEKKIEATNEHERIVSEKIEKSADTELISTGKAEALVGTAENLLTQVSALAQKIESGNQKAEKMALENLQLSLPQNVVSHNIHADSPHTLSSEHNKTQEIRFH